MSGIERGVGLSDALAADESVAALLAEPDIARGLDPAAALGASGEFVDRVLAAAGRLGDHP
jgi:hypothetical protein